MAKAAKDNKKAVITSTRTNAHASSKKGIIAASVCFLALALYFSRSFLSSEAITRLSASSHISFFSSWEECSLEQPAPFIPGCSARSCGRFVSDDIISNEEAKGLLDLAVNAMAYGAPASGATVLDLHSGSLTKGNEFVNFYELVAHPEAVVTEKDFQNYKQVHEKVEKAVLSHFGLQQIFLSSPTFFSCLTNKTAKSPEEYYTNHHHQYWHMHVDRKTYPEFAYTCLIYLADQNVTFTGGEFVFKAEKSEQLFTVEPKLGRLSCFTSGYEHPHRVNKVISGARYALTIGFTCDPRKAIADPQLKH